MHNDVIPAGLTDDEASFVYNVEVLELPARKAAELAGMPFSKANKPHIIQAREIAKRELRGNLQVTKEDVTFGIKDAIGRARLLAEPMTEIVGWEKLAKLHGLDAPQRVDININATIDVIQQQLKTLSDAELVKRMGAGDIIDGDFYDVEAKD
jgi:hypothetical protein